MSSYKIGIVRESLGSELESTLNLRTRNKELLDETRSRE